MFLSACENVVSDQISAESSEISAEKKQSTGGNCQVTMQSMYLYESKLSLLESR